MTGFAKFGPFHSGPLYFDVSSEPRLPGCRQGRWVRRVVPSDLERSRTMFTMDVGKTWTSTRAFNGGPRAAYQHSSHEEAPAGGAGAKRTTSVYDRNIKSLGEFMTVPAPAPRSQQSLGGSMGGSMRLPSSAETSRVFGPAAGARHEKLGVFGSEHGAIGSRYFESLSQGRTEEERRQLLVTGERHRRGAHLKYKQTDTLGVMHQQEQDSAAAAASFYQKQQQRATQQQPQQPPQQPQQGREFGARSAMPMVAVANSPQDDASAIAAIYLATHKPFKGAAALMR